MIGRRFFAPGINAEKLKAETLKAEVGRQRTESGLTLLGVASDPPSPSSFAKATASQGLLRKISRASGVASNGEKDGKSSPSLRE